MNEEKENLNKDLEESKATEETSAEKAVPAAEEASVEEAAPAAEEASVEETSPAAEEAIVAEETVPEEEVNPYARFLLGTKIGMTSIFSDSGVQYPATVIEAGPCFVSQIKTDENDGYNAVQIGFKFDKKANKPKKNHFSKNECEPMKHVKEFRIDKDDQFVLGEKNRC